MALPHDKLSIFYRQLSQQLGAGLTLAQSLRAASPAPAADTFRLAARAEAGESVAVIFAAAGSWLPVTDRPFLNAAAAAGRLPLVLANLADRHAQIATSRSRVVMACIYPLVVFHLGALLVPFLRLIDFEQGLQGGVSDYIRGLLAILIPVWGGAAFLWWLTRRENPLALALLDLAPAIGGYRRHQALADFAFALGNLLEAGAPIGPAWLDAGGIARSRRLREAAEKIRVRVECGEAPGPHLAALGVFPDAFVARYQTGEITGSLETSLFGLAADHQATANQRLQAASILYPSLLFGAVALMIAWIVISFVMQYYGTINRMLDGM